MCNCVRLGTDEQVKKFEDVLAEYKGSPDNVMVVLQKTQGIFGYIPELTIRSISESIRVPESKIYGIITFYSQFTLTPKAKYNIDICLGTACYVKGSQLVLDKFSELLGIKAGETTEDGLFTLDVLRCIGACAVAPAVSINGKVYPQVKVDNVKNIVAEYRAKEA